MFFDSKTCAHILKATHYIVTVETIILSHSPFALLCFHSHYDHWLDACPVNQEHTLSVANKQAMDATATFVHTLVSAETTPKELSQDASHIDRLLNAEKVPCDAVLQSVQVFEKLKASSEPPLGSKWVCFFRNIVLFCKFCDVFCLVSVSIVFFSDILYLMVSVFSQHCAEELSIATQSLFGCNQSWFQTHCRCETDVGRT